MTWDVSYETQYPLHLGRVIFYAVTQTWIWLMLYYKGQRSMRRKECQTWWQLIAYSIMFAWGVQVLLNENVIDIFSRPFDMFARPTIKDSEHPIFLLSYLEFELSWYLSNFILNFWNRDSKDFYAMLFHHTITPLQIYFGWPTGIHLPVLVVLVLHDCSDVFLHAAKSFHYRNKGILTDATFAVFTLVFFITRLVLLPVVALSGTQAVNPHNATRWLDSVLINATWVFIGLHFYWFTLIVQILLRALRAGAVEGDIREEESMRQSANMSKPIKTD